MVVLLIGIARTIGDAGGESSRTPRRAPAWQQRRMRLTRGSNKPPRDGTGVGAVAARDLGDRRRAAGARWRHIVRQASKILAVAQGDRVIVMHEAEGELTRTRQLDAAPGQRVM